jgi:DNA-binding protein WhiA
MYQIGRDKMSFASDTKSELLNIKSDKCCLLAELAALLAINGQVAISNEGLKVEFSTTNLKIARRVITSIKALYHVEVDIVSKKQMKLTKHDQYIVIIKHKANTIINELGLMNQDEPIEPNFLMKECDQKAYLRGAFLASGSINSPASSSYHLEIFTHQESLANALKDLMNVFHLNAKMVARRTGFITYIKESEKISDFIRVVGANNALFTYEDERIKRDFVNSITRVMNMDIANQNKTLEAADKQLRNISIIENMMDLERLPRSVTEAITLRKEYPEASLKELSQASIDVLGKSVSKSALNHRYRNIQELADDLMESVKDD